MWKPFIRLWVSHYELFIKEFKSDKEKTNLDYYSANAIKYFSTLCNQNERYKETLKFPLIQLANYKGDLNEKKLYESYKFSLLIFQFQLFRFTRSGWQSNYSVNQLI